MSSLNSKKITEGLSENIVAILTDFGYSDNYVAIMKAVAIRENSKLKFIDISHGVKDYCVTCGAYLLYTSYKWFPKGTVFLAVIDPGVGSDRKPIIVESSEYFFVGPDNGIFWPIVEENMRSSRAYVIDLQKLGIGKPSYTFHGRDIFAPVAARLAESQYPLMYGSPIAIESLIKLSLFRKKELGRMVCYEVIYSDKFGDTVLSARFSELNLKEGERLEVLRERDGLKIEANVTKSFSLIKEGEVALYENSFGFAELAINRGNFFSTFNFQMGDYVCIEMR